jgi:hypothetical protein
MRMRRSSDGENVAASARQPAEQTDNRRATSAVASGRTIADTPGGTVG